MDKQPFKDVVRFEDLSALGEHYRKLGKTIVSTNGCFDLLHAGHAGMLAEARELGDVLVVGINDDASVRQIKGPGRPLVDQSDRAVLLAAMKAVDHVVIFDGLLPSGFLDRLRPHIHCKAADYTPQSMPEAAIVERNGGRVHILPLKGGYATSETLNQIVKAAQGTVESGSRTTPDDPKQADTYSRVLLLMLSGSNLCRQAGYQFGQRIARAVDAAANARRRGATLWVCANDAELAQFLVSAINSSGRPFARVLPNSSGASAFPADLDVVLAVELAQGAALCLPEGPTRKVILCAGAWRAGDQTRNVTIPVAAETPVLARQLQWAILHVFCTALT